MWLHVLQGSRKTLLISNFSLVCLCSGDPYGIVLCRCATARCVGYSVMCGCQVRLSGSCFSLQCFEKSFKHHNTAKSNGLFGENQHWHSKQVFSCSLEIYLRGSRDTSASRVMQLCPAEGHYNLTFLTLKPLLNPWLNIWNLLWSSRTLWKPTCRPSFIQDLPSRETQPPRTPSRDLVQLAHCFMLLPRGAQAPL